MRIGSRDSQLPTQSYTSGFESTESSSGFTTQGCSGSWRYGRQRNDSYDRPCLVPQPRSGSLGRLIIDHRLLRRRLHIRTSWVTNAFCAHVTVHWHSIYVLHRRQICCVACQGDGVFMQLWAALGQIDRHAYDPRVHCDPRAAIYGHNRRQLQMFVSTYVAFW